MFEKDMEELEKLYGKNKDVTEKEFNEFIKSLKKETNENADYLDKIGIHTNKDIFYLVIIYIAIAIYGLVMLIPNHLEMIGVYIFGLVFFIAGIQIGLSKETKGFGLIFVFSHGGSGLGIMLYSLLFERFSLDALSDLSNNAKLYLFFTIAILTIAVLSIVVYNLSDKLKRKYYNKDLVLLLFAAAIFLVGMFPIVKF